MVASRRGKDASTFECVYYRLTLKMSFVDFGIDQCAINCLTLLNSALVIWVLRFVHQVWLCKWGYLGRSTPIHNTFFIVT